MLKKENMIAGSTIKTRNVLKDGLGGAAGSNQTSDELDYLRLLSKPYASFDSTYIPIPKNTTLTVLDKPKKKNGINVARVAYGDREGYVFWCELRVSCDHV